MAQLVERHLAKVETAGSSPVYRSKKLANMLVSSGKQFAGNRKGNQTREGVDYFFFMHMGTQMKYVSKLRVPGAGVGEDGRSPTRLTILLTLLRLEFGNIIQHN